MFAFTWFVCCCFVKTRPHHPQRLVRQVRDGQQQKAREGKGHWCDGAAAVSGKGLQAHPHRGHKGNKNKSSTQMHVVLAALTCCCWLLTRCLGSSQDSQDSTTPAWGRRRAWRCCISSVESCIRSCPETRNLSGYQSNVRPGGRGRGWGSGCQAFPAEESTRQRLQLH